MLSVSVLFMNNELCYELYN